MSVATVTVSVMLMVLIIYNEGRGPSIESEIKVRQRYLGQESLDYETDVLLDGSIRRDAFAIHFSVT